MEEEERFSSNRIHSAYDLNHIARITRKHCGRRFYEYNGRTYDRCTNEPVSIYDLSTMHELFEEIKNDR